MTRSNSPQLLAQPWRPALSRYRLDQLITRGAPWAAVLAVTAVLCALAYGMNHTNYLIWGGFWVAPALLILSIPLANRAARLDGDTIGRIVLIAAGIKVLIAPLLRYWMAFSVYGGSADASRYHLAGRGLAPLFRQGVYSNLGEISGTRFIEVLTGQLYAITGPTRLGGFMVFSWFSFLGCYLFYRAFCTAYPDGDRRRYALLVFFFPTLLFWPSSMGKEAFMMLALGGAALGAAQLIVGSLRGFLWLALGLWGAAVVRPHMALMVGAGLAVAAAIAVLRGGTQAERRQRGRLGGAVLGAALIFSGSIVVGMAEKFFHLDSLNVQTAQEILDETTRRSGQGGSAFEKASPNTPVGLALGGVTVLFRPFPFEARNAQAMLTSLEGLVLLILCARSLPRLARTPAELLRRPYIAFAVVYTFSFLYAFASLENFGILARQRALLLPVLFVVLSIPRERYGAPRRLSAQESRAS